MIVRVLVENTPGAACEGEHGLCLFVEYRGRKILIDSGASGLFACNAKKLGIDLEQVELAFLSHAHHDHAGGYPAFFAVNRDAKVCLQSASAGLRCCWSDGTEKRDVGIPEGVLEQHADRFVYVDGAARICEGIRLLPHSTEGITERARRAGLCVEEDGEIRFDDFRHEQTVVFEEEDGLVCVNCCSHAGVDVIMEEAERAFPGKRIKAYIGGFHMMGAGGASTCAYSEEEVRKVAEKLKADGDTVFYSGHCTGTVAFPWLREVLEDRLVALQTGKVFEV